MIIYILELENGKYYVGKTNNLDKRLNQHKYGFGSEWTKKYKFINLIEIINSESNFDEDKYTKIYMDKFGIDNVRGGSYNKIELTNNQKENLMTELRTSNNICYRCGRNSHFIKNCYAKTDLNGNILFTNKKTNEEIKVEEFINTVVSASKSIYRYFKWK
jgi:hypothetical protein